MRIIPWSVLTCVLINSSASSIVAATGTAWSRHHHCKEEYSELFKNTEWTVVAAAVMLPATNHAPPPLRVVVSVAGMTGVFLPQLLNYYNKQFSLLQYSDTVSGICICRAAYKQAIKERLCGFFSCPCQGNTNNWLKDKIHSLKKVMTSPAKVYSHLCLWVYTPKFLSPQWN